MFEVKRRLEVAYDPNPSVRDPAESAAQMATSTDRMEIGGGSPSTEQVQAAGQLLELEPLLAPRDKAAAIATVYRHLPSLEIARKLRVASPSLAEVSKQFADTVLHPQPPQPAAPAKAPVAIPNSLTTPTFTGRWQDALDTRKLSPELFRWVHSSLDAKDIAYARNPFGVGAPQRPANYLQTTQTWEARKIVACLDLQSGDLCSKAKAPLYFVSLLVERGQASQVERPAVAAAIGRVLKADYASRVEDALHAPFTYDAHSLDFGLETLNATNLGVFSPRAEQMLDAAVVAVVAADSGKRGPSIRALASAIAGAARVMSQELGLPKTLSQPFVGTAFHIKKAHGPALPERLAEIVLEKIRAHEAHTLPPIESASAQSFVEMAPTNVEPIPPPLFRALLDAWIPADVLGKETVKAMGIRGEGKDFLAKLFGGAYEGLTGPQRRALGGELYEQMEQHADQAALANTLLNHLGPGYIKLVQVVSSRPELVPDAVQRATLAKACDQALRIPFAEFKRAAEAELGHPLETIFAHVDEEPIGTGSLGQVHRAVLKDGREVVIKIVKPGAGEALIANLKYLQSFFAEHAPEATMVRSLIDEILRGAEAEGDLRQEAVATQKAFAINRLRGRENTTTVPFVSFASKHLLVSNFIAVKRFAPADLETARQMYAQLFLQIFDDGFFHGDPNAGNAMHGGAGVAFLDWGLNGTMDHYREPFRELVQDYVKNPNATTALANRMKALCNKFNPLKALMAFAVKGGLMEKLDALSKADLGMAPSMILAIKAIVQAEGTLKNLDPRFSTEEFLRDHFIRDNPRRDPAAVSEILRAPPSGPLSPMVHALIGE